MREKRNFVALVLAAGKGTRMKSGLPKVLHEVGGEPMLFRVVRKINALNPGRIIVVTGHGGKEVERAAAAWAKENGIGRMEFKRQKLLAGSGRAVFETGKAIGRGKSVLIACGDAPLIETDTLRKIKEFFVKNRPACAVLTAEVEDPGNYGRIKRDAEGNVVAIVEASEAGEEERRIKEINSGLYVFDSGMLLSVLSGLKRKGPKKEYYLTDAVEEIVKKGGRVLAFRTGDFAQTAGINSRGQLAAANAEYYRRNAEKLMEKGVSVINPACTYIEDSVRVGRDTVVYPGVFIRGKTRIGKNCVVGPYSWIENSEIGEGCEIKFSCVILSSRLRKNCVVGPFAHIRPDSDIGPGAKVGNFSEIKKSRIREGSKVPHLSYVGDTEMGKGVNVGAGSITCNYDGVKKHRTIIGDRVFVGSNTNLVAPIRIGKGALIGAGSTLTEDVPAGRLALGRARQVVKTIKKRKGK